MKQERGSIGKPEQQRYSRTSSNGVGEPLSEIDFRLYGEALRVYGVPDADVDRQVRGCREAFINGPRKTRQRIVDTFTSVLDAVMQPERRRERVAVPIDPTNEITIRVKQPSEHIIFRRN